MLAALVFAASLFALQIPVVSESSPCRPSAWEHDDLVKCLPGQPSSFSSKQFAGFASVNFGEVEPQQGQSLFYWFVGAQDGDYRERPTVLWTNGGPGSSSFWGFFAENGPFIVEDDLTLTPRPHAWSDQVNYVIFEHPLNVTLSSSRGQLPQTVEDGVLQWHNAIRNFVRKHPEIGKTPWLLTGESYAGTYLPLLAKYTLEANAVCYRTSECVPIDVQAVVIGDGWVDPILQMEQDLQYAYSHGLISARQQRQLDRYWRPRNFYCGGLVNGSSWNATGFCSRNKEWTTTVADEIENISGVYMANIASRGDPSTALAIKYLNQPAVRRALHVKESWNVPPISSESGFSSNAIWALWGKAQFRSYKHVLEKLLEDGLHVIVLNGLNDAKDSGFLGVAAYLDTLKGEVADRFHEAQTHQWRAAVRTADLMLPNRPSSLPAAFAFQNACPGAECCAPDELCEYRLGYIQSAGDGGLSFVKVLNAGHLAAADQPLIIDLLLNMTNLSSASSILHRSVFI